MHTGFAMTLFQISPTGIPIWGQTPYSPNSPLYLLQIAGWMVWGKEIDVVALIASFLIGPVPCGPVDLRSAHGYLPCKGPRIQPQSARVSHRVSPFLALATHVLENDAPKPVVIPSRRL
jgi:hypothetical protein